MNSTSHKISDQTPQLNQLPFLRIYISGEFVRNFRLESGTCVVGRGPDCTVQVEGAHVSRSHFQIEFFGSTKLTLQDLSSRFGTFLNGEKTSRAPLAHGDVIEIGEVRLVVSHPSFARSKVLQFPKLRTDPGTPAAKFPKVISKAQVQEPSLFAKALGFVVMLGFALGLAIGTNEWFKRRKNIPIQIVLPPSKPRIKPTIVPVLETPKIEVPQIVKNQPTSNPTPEPVKRLKIENPKLVVKSSPPVELKQEPSEMQKLSASLDKSLDGLEKNDLSGIDRKTVKANSGRSESNLTALKAFKNDPKRLDIEIIMPKSDIPMSGHLSSNKPQREFDPHKYQTMLRTKIVGVEACYVQNVKDGKPGKVSIWFSIYSNGTVKSSGVEQSTLHNAGLESCILSRISKLQVDPPPWDGFTVTYGFHFGSQQLKF